MSATKILVVGGGPAGLMAAGQAAMQGAHVILLEKMNRPGRKLRITGKGRCNLTNIVSLTEFVGHFGSNGKFLRNAFAQFFSQDLLDFFSSIGIQTVTERGGRVFPVTQKAEDVVDALIRWTTRCGVEIRNTVKVHDLIKKNNRITGVSIASSETMKADAVIIATGGKSYPATGSTGDGYRMAKSAGHSIVPVRPALVPLVTTGDIASRLQGLSLRNVNARLLVGNRLQTEQLGEMLFTHFGLSGPIILTLSRTASDAVHNNKDVVISIDLKPALDKEKLDHRLLRELNNHGKQQFRNILKTLLPAKLIPVCLDLLPIPPEKTGHQISSSERKQLRDWLKDFRFTITGTRPLSEAIVTAGGVHTKEVNPKTMESRLIRNLYFAGEVLDIDGDTGGYNLQAAFSTGWIAGRSAAETKC